jgi:hypothetical protein
MVLIAALAKYYLKPEQTVTRDAECWELKSELSSSSLENTLKSKSD